MPRRVFGHRFRYSALVFLATALAMDHLPLLQLSGSNIDKFAVSLSKLPPLPATILVPGEEVMTEGSGEIFTLDEVAVYLKAGKRTVYRLAATKKISAFKVGGTWRFSRQKIDQSIKRQTNDDTSGGGSKGNG